MPTTRLSYYERWIYSIAQPDPARRISVDELGRKMVEAQTVPMAAAEGIAPQFHSGDRVAVRAAYPIGHVRTPYYIRGKRGVIERLCGAYGNPRNWLTPARACRNSRLYRVRFLQREVGLRTGQSRIPSISKSSNTGWSRPDMPHDRSPARHDHRQGHTQPHRIRRARTRTTPSLNGGDGDRGARAANREGHPQRGEVRRQVEDMDKRTPLQGARVVARAWIDPEFRKLLLSDGNAAARRSAWKRAVQAGVVENTDQCKRHRVHAVLLLSRWLLGCHRTGTRAATTDRGRSMNARSTDSAPRSQDITVRVHDSTADMRYLVLPKRPAGTDGLVWGETRRAGEPRLHDRRRVRADP